MRQPFIIIVVVVVVVMIYLLNHSDRVPPSARPVSLARRYIPRYSIYSGPRLGL